MHNCSSLETLNFKLDKLCNKFLKVDIKAWYTLNVHTDRYTIIHLDYLRLLFYFFFPLLSVLSSCYCRFSWFICLLFCFSLFSLIVFSLLSSIWNPFFSLKFPECFLFLYWWYIIYRNNSKISISTPSFFCPVIYLAISKNFSFIILIFRKKGKTDKYIWLPVYKNR